MLRNKIPLLSTHRKVYNKSPTATFVHKFKSRLRIPHMAKCNICPKCNTTETQDHILTSCQASGQETVWTLVKKIVRKKGINWTRPRNVGDILISCLPDNRPTALSADSEGKDRLRTLIVTESAWLIWTLRCSWRIRILRCLSTKTRHCPRWICKQACASMRLTKALKRVLANLSLLIAIAGKPV